MGISFTDRELKRAWRQLRKNSRPHGDGKRENGHRLLLFYAVECGLKAVWLKRNGQTLFSDADIKQTGHNLAHILTFLHAGHNIKLPDNVQLKSVRGAGGSQQQRNGNTESLHQIWRYGGECQNPADEVCEERLEEVWNWIEGELR